MGVVWEKENIN
jgi:hypothetical protein